jgi:hypothetical protein
MSESDPTSVVAPPPLEPHAPALDQDIIIPKKPQPTAPVEEHKPPAHKKRSHSKERKARSSHKRHRSRSRSPKRRSVEDSRRRRRAAPNEICKIILLGSAQRRYAEHIRAMMERDGILPTIGYLDRQPIQTAIHQAADEGADYIILLGKENETNTTVSLKIVSDPGMLFLIF